MDLNTVFLIACFVVGGLIVINLPYFLSILKWLAIDIYRFFKNKPPLRLYGIFMFVGLYGMGKTMGMSEYLTDMRNRYKDKIYICTNYGFKDEDFTLDHWKKMLPEYDKPIIFGFDEIQNEFDSRDFQNFPWQLVQMLTQNRKGNGKQIVCTAQRFMWVDKRFRDLCTHVIECKSAWFGRVTKCRKYSYDDYMQFINEIDIARKRKIPFQRHKFVQTDALRNSYDSFKMLESAKSKKYISASEKLAKMLAESV